MLFADIRGVHLREREREREREEKGASRYSFYLHVQVYHYITDTVFPTG